MLPALGKEVVHDAFSPNEVCDRPPRVLRPAPAAHTWAESPDGVELPRYVRAAPSLSRRCGVVDLELQHLRADDVLVFLDHLETERKNSVATRNARPVAIHAFARFLGTRDPEQVEEAQRLLAVPIKRGPARAVDYLEGDAMLEAVSPDRQDHVRDRALLLALFNTGARVQELLDIRASDLQVDRPTFVRLRGKGRKERLCPLWEETVNALRALLRATPASTADTRPHFSQPSGRTHDPLRCSIPAAPLRRTSTDHRPQPIGKYEEMAVQRILIQPRLPVGVKAVKARPHIDWLQGDKDAGRRGEAWHEDPRSCTESASRQRTVSPPAPSTSIAHRFAGAEATPANLISRNTTGAGRRTVARASVNHFPGWRHPNRDSPLV